MSDTTIEWFGATTYRLKHKSVTIFLDTWLDRPSGLPKHLSIADVTEADYIFISHAHFDHLPGADRMAKATGATVVANSEAINRLAAAGVPETQLIPVAGGERIPLFSRAVCDAAVRGECATAPSPPGAPVKPDPSLATMAVHVWPSLHCLMPGTSHADVPDIMDTGKEYHGAASQYACTLDITFGMKYGLLRMRDWMPDSAMDEGRRAFAAYVADPRNVLSACDGGQLMFNFLMDGKAMLWMAHLGGYQGILERLEPKPDVAVMAIAGRGNLDGRPFEGSAAQFATKALKWLGEPQKVIWCLHDESIIKPFSVDTQPAKEMVEKETLARVSDLKPAALYSVFV